MTLTVTTGGAPESDPELRGGKQATSMTDVQQLADRLEITDVLSRYHRAVDGLDWELLRDRVVTEDAVWEWSAADDQARVEDSAAGREAVVTWLDAALRGSTVRHHTTSHLFEVAGDGARSESYMFVVDRQTLQTLASGVVTADHVRSGRGWRIRRLRIDEQLTSGTVAAMAGLLGVATKPL
jgi:hypothetical protein